MFLKGVFIWERCGVSERIPTARTLFSRVSTGTDFPEDSMSRQRPCTPILFYVINTDPTANSNNIFCGITNDEKSIAKTTVVSSNTLCNMQ